MEFKPGANRSDRRNQLIRNQLGRDAVPVVSQSLPRAIDVEEFTRARLNEISILKQAMDNKVGGNSRAAQDLPRHLRRRAGSHNIYRLPARLRARAKNEIKDIALKSGTKPKRRERRRPSNAMQDNERRSRKHQWLETHLWHAKRMHMANYWGFRTALEPTDKGQRATLKAAQHFSTIFDASASSCLQIDGDLQIIVACLSPVLQDGANALTLASTTCRRRELMVYDLNDESSSASVAPCDFLWNPSIQDTSRSLWIWIHPSVRDHLHRLFVTCFEPHSDIVKMCWAELVKFELTGARCQMVLSNSLRPGPLSSPRQLQMWKAMANIRSQGSLPRGVCLALDVQDPRRFSTAQHFESIYPNATDNRIPNEIATMLHAQLNTWPLELADSMLWSEHQRHQASVALQDGNAGDVPVLLIQRQFRSSRCNMAMGWDLILPKGWAMAFWKSLVFSGARAIGLSSRRHILLEQGIPCFPDDFPDTAAGAMKAAYHSQIAAAKHNRTPKAKRVNYSGNGIVSPFQPDWSLVLPSIATAPAVLDDCSPSDGLGVVGDAIARPRLHVVRTIVDFTDSGKIRYPSNAMIRICVRMRFRGVPHDQAMVYAPTTDDINLIGIPSNKGNASSSPVFDSASPRRIIAIITAGGFQFASGAGIGYGFASVSALQELSKDKTPSSGAVEWIVLVRNVNSKVMQGAVASIAH